LKYVGLSFLPSEDYPNFSRCHLLGRPFELRNGISRYFLRDKTTSLKHKDLHSLEFARNFARFRRFGRQQRLHKWR